MLLSLHSGRRAGNVPPQINKDAKQHAHVFDMLHDSQQHARSCVPIDKRSAPLPKERGASLDVLPVYMMDRLRCIADDTPVIAKTITSRGVEIWSGMEEQRHFGTQSDHLMNYLRAGQNLDLKSFPSANHPGNGA